MPVYLADKVVRIGNKSSIVFDTKADAQHFIELFKAIFNEISGCNFMPQDVQLFSDSDTVSTQQALKQEFLAYPIPEAGCNLPEFFMHQDRICMNSDLQSDLRKLGTQFCGESKTIVFISHAWQISAQDAVNYRHAPIPPPDENYIDCFTVRLSDHLELLGFQTLLDFKDSRVGHSLQNTMRTFVYEADFMIALGTATYFYKWDHGMATTGIKIERSFADKRIASRQSNDTKLENFLLPFTTCKVPGGHPLFDGVGAGGSIAHSFLGPYGYAQGLIHIVRATHVEDPPKAKAFEDSLVAILVKHGLYRKISEMTTLSSTEKNTAPLLRSQ